MVSTSFSSCVHSLQVGLALAALSTAASVHAQIQPSTLYVDASAPASGNGLLWTSAFRDIQDALFAANTRLDKSRPIEIHLAQGTYTPDGGTFDRARSIVLNSGVSMMGGFAGLLGSVPSHNDPAQFVSVISGDLARNDGPGISTRSDNSYGLLVLREQCGRVDGITLRGATTAILTSAFDWKTISRCIITDNVGVQGYSVSPFYYYFANCLSLSRAQLTDCTISSNTSTLFSILRTDTCILQRCRFVGNRYTRLSTVGDTAALADLRGTTLLTCLLAANTSSDEGVVLSAGSTVANCTVASNTAATNPAFNISGATVLNCVLADNRSTSTTTPTHQVSLSNQGSIRSTLLTRGLQDIRPGGFGTSANLVSSDPLFLSPAGPDGDPFSWQDNDYRLRPGSPCVDHSDTTGALYALPYSDWLGHSPADDPNTPNTGVGAINFLDLGAYEFVPSICRADFNNSGSLSAQDIFDFLNAWFALNPLADFNNSGTLSPQDIFDFLNAWFAGC